MKSKHRQ